MEKIKQSLASGDPANNDKFVCSHCGGRNDTEDSVQTSGGLICASCADGSAVWAALREWEAQRESGETLAFAEWMRESGGVSYAVGDEVWWNDPDHRISSGYYRVESVRGEIITIKNEAGSTAQAFVHELSPTKPDGLLPVVYDGEVCGHAKSAEEALECGYNFVCADVSEPMHAEKVEWPIGEDRAKAPVWVVRDGAKPELARIRLTLDVTYDLNGENAVEMQKNLRRMAERAIGEGLLTGESDAEVDQYSMEVTEFPDVDEDEIADFMLQRIESGDLALEDIPVRLARYGLMPSDDFANEMRERIDMSKGCA